MFNFSESTMYKYKYRLDGWRRLGISRKMADRPVKSLNCQEIEPV